jgi:nicotinamide-nucleotide amidase
MSEKLQAWILTIGNEIINAVITDTNRETVSRELRSLGIGVKGMSSVGDTLEDICNALDYAMHKAPVTIVSGGLGPTEDDKTAEAAARYLDVELQLQKEQLARIENRFKQWNRPMPPTNTKQALLPAGSNPLPNDFGTAPGFQIEKNGSIALFFPGIPRELIGMFRNEAVPLIRRRFGSSELYFKNRTIHVYGLSESRLGEVLADLAADEENYHLAFLPRFPIIRLRIDVNAETETAAENLLEEKASVITARIRENVITAEKPFMEYAVYELLKERGLTLTLAESITGGMIGEMLTRVPGGSDVLMGSIVSYSNEMKESILGVTKQTLQTHGAVSHECAKEMAIGAKRAGGSDIGLSITGIAGPGGGSEEKPVGTFYVGMAHPEGLISRGFLMPGTREWVRTLAAMQSLDLLRRFYSGFTIHGTEL